VCSFTNIYQQNDPNAGNKKTLNKAYGLCNGIFMGDQWNIDGILMGDSFGYSHPFDE